MTITFLSDCLSRCAITRGVIRPRRAFVSLGKRDGDPYAQAWRFDNSGAECDAHLAWAIDQARTREINRRRLIEERARFEQDWQAVGSGVVEWLRFPVGSERLPRARRVTR